jgi:isocitrate dehydrogenase (NAD+)
MECCRAAAERFPKITYDEAIIDACCMQLVMNPRKFDVLVTPNLYGNIVTSVVSGLVGGPGVVSAVHRGDKVSVYEAVCIVRWQKYLVIS